MLALRNLIEEWLENHKTLWHFYVAETEDAYRFQTRCSCPGVGWWLAIDTDFVYIGTEVCDLNKPPRLYVSDPEFFAKLEEILVKGHLKWKGEFRGRSA